MPSSSVTVISVGRAGKEIGDYYIEGIKEGLANGFFREDDYGWYEGLAEWRLLTEIVKILDAPPAPVVIARAILPSVVDAFRNARDRIVSGKSNLAKERRNLHNLMELEGIRSDERIYSNAFIGSVLNTNIDLAYGLQQWREGNEKGALEAFPAQELIRFENRDAPRDWVSIWDAARDMLADKTSATRAKETGRMIAMKNDPIWVAISDFSLPYPPFKFDSGMGVEDISYEEAVSVGVMDADGEPLRPSHEFFRKGYVNPLFGLKDNPCEGIE